MSVVYLEFNFVLNPRDPYADILIAQLGALGFESFVEGDTGVLAYIQKPDWKEGMFDGLSLPGPPQLELAWSLKEIEPQNWNARWEENFNPIRVGGNCVVRAPFHPVPQVEYDIVIEPKMSFGTGHHQTTHMMLQFLLGTHCRGKAVLDMGCGTGVLAILAKKRGAGTVEAIDVDSWCYLNALENVERNHCPEIAVHQGNSELLEGRKYDLILANINRNILLADIPVYAKCLNPGGSLIMSGFYAEDLEAISERCRAHGLEYEKKRAEDHWIAVKYVN